MGRIKFRKAFGSEAPVDEQIRSEINGKTEALLDQTGWENMQAMPLYTDRVILPEESFGKSNFYLYLSNRVAFNLTANGAHGPGTIQDKSVYSSWADGRQMLLRLAFETMVIHLCSGQIMPFKQAYVVNHHEHYRSILRQLAGKIRS